MEIAKFIDRHISKITCVWGVICIMISVYGFQKGNMMLGIFFAFYALWMLELILKYGGLDD